MTGVATGPAGPAGGVVRLNGVGLAYDECGAGEPPLLLVHGFAHNRRGWSGVLGELAAGRRVVRYDQRGHGDSTHTGQPDSYTLDLLLADLVGFVAARGLAPVDLLGHSMGGLVALRFALAHPDQVRSLILVNASVAPTGALPAAVVDRLVGRGRTAGMAALADMLDRLGAFSRRQRGPVQREHLYDGVSRMDVEAFAALGEELDRFESLLPLLRTLDLPVTVIYGDGDEPARIQADAMAAGIPGSRCRPIPAAAHVPHQQNPAAWLGAVHAHLAEVAAQPDAQRGGPP